MQSDCSISGMIKILDFVIAVFALFMATVIGTSSTEQPQVILAEVDLIFIGMDMA